jgi:hypothetical protein
MQDCIDKFEQALDAARAKADGFAVIDIANTLSTLTFVRLWYRQMF